MDQYIRSQRPNYDKRCQSTPFCVHWMTNPMATTPRARGEPANIANAILILASPAASYITGHLLRADGGFTIS